MLRQLAPWAIGQAVGGLPLVLSLMGHTLRQQTHDRQPRRLQAALDRLQNRLTRLQLAQPQAPGRHSLEVVLKNVGMVALVGGVYGQAKQYLQEGLGLACQIGNLEYVTKMLTNLGGWRVFGKN